MECTPSSRLGNLQRAEWRNKCRAALSDHLSMLRSDLWTIPQLTKLGETTLGITVEPAQVRLQPKVEDGYIWKPLPNKEHLFKRYLFTKQLSKQSIGVYMELYREVGYSFEAAPRDPREFQESEGSSIPKVASRINCLELDIASLTQDRNTWKHQAQENSEAIKSAEGKIKQLELDLRTAQAHIERLEQQKIELSSAAWSSREKAERSSRVLREALTVLQKGQAFYPITTNEECGRSQRCQIDLDHATLGTRDHVG